MRVRVVAWRTCHRSAGSLPRPAAPCAIPSSPSGQPPGLPVFGLPLTEPLAERTVDDGRAYLVQYTERQRLEYHPELAGTPYAMLLGRLGAEEAARRGLLTHWAFQPVDPAAPERPDCLLVAAVGHRLCGEYRPYWEGHGLELDEGGVTFRESLALFGYPLSEEFIDPETGRITQYFDRARFEYHPALPVGQRVLLGRLGTSRACSLINRPEELAPGCQ